MSMTHQEFSEETLIALLRALRARAASHPDNPGLRACWPGVREDRMAAGCGELIRRGHPVQRTLMPCRSPGVTRTGWALGSPN
jgi:hypothetical protein